MSDDFCFDIAPFDELSATEQALVRETAAPICWRAGDTPLTATVPTQHVWLLTAGHVQVEENEHSHLLGAGETIGWRALLTERSRATARALDTVQAWQLPRTTVLALLADNARFSAQVFADLSRQLVQEEDVNHNRELLSLMLIRVRDIPLHPPFYVDGALDLVSVCRVMSEHKRTSALVRDTEAGVPRLGFFTTTDLRDALLRPEPPTELPIRELAHFALITLPADAELFDALLTMLRHRVHRLLIKEGDEIVGVLSQLDLMAFVSNHSHLITLQVDQASSAQELKVAAQQVDDSVALLMRGGVRIDLVSRLVSGLNAQIFARLWSLLAPADLVKNSCLLVMGSEGRGEQILKTDQDNALLLRDGYECAGLADIVERFSTALLSFGYPTCPGNIMLTNPLWCQPLAKFKETVGLWLFGDDPDGAMNLAIFMDAHAVSGDATLLASARAHAMNLAAGNDAFVAHLAGAIHQFSALGNGLWGRLSKLRGQAVQTFDLKKLGTFPIVHGVRALALEQRLDALSTVERLRILADQHCLPQQLARDLVETLHFMMTLKLRHNMLQMGLGQPVDNLVPLSGLSTLERDLLKDALAIVKQFRLHLQMHFRLDV